MARKRYPPLRRFFIPFRPDTEPVEFWNLPEDLTPAEADRIARIIKAFAVPEPENC